ncbi:MAG: hypothetical protein ACK4SZ_10545 [Allosphingosinicella sp.]|uniref:hypothetical protein n=1 Tax=Allosphingosinicella sp. TaxID=2823234 RepID=UPI003955E248
MPERTGRGSGPAWVAAAVLIILLGVVVAMLYRMGKVPLWLSTAGTVITAVGAILAALAANRAYRNGGND